MFRGVPGKWKNHNRNVRWLLWKLQFRWETQYENEDKSEKLSFQGLSIAQVFQRSQRHGWLGTPDGMFSKSLRFISRHPSGYAFVKGEETVGSSSDETSVSPIRHGQHIFHVFSRLLTDARHDVSSPGTSCYALLCLMSLTEKTFGKMDMTSKHQSPVKLLCVSGSTCDQLFREHEFCLQRKPFGKDASVESNQKAISVFRFVSWQDWAAV